MTNTILIEYHEAKKNYNASKPTEKNANHKKNAHAIRPTFDAFVAEKQPKKEIDRRPTTVVQLPPDYNTAKLMYRASKSRSAAMEGDLSERGGAARIPRKTKIVPGVSERSTEFLSAQRRTESRSSKPNFREVLTTPVSSARTAELVRVPPTVESGLKALGLLRPIDNKSYEFGLANGIRMHLVESVKLCGIKKAREKPIMDMIATLCNHLTSREEEINRWIEFADKIALSAAEKLDRSMLEYEDICISKDETQSNLKSCQQGLLLMNRELQSLKKDLLLWRDDVLDVMKTFPPLTRECEDRLRQQLRNHSNGQRSVFESRIRDAVERINTSHDGERQRLSYVISALESSNRGKIENMKTLHDKLNKADVALEEVRSASASTQELLRADGVKARNERQGAMERIKSLEELLENERIHKKKELGDVEERMRVELDAIDQKVKASFKTLVEGKNRVIEDALGRARAAEASANAAHKLLSDLRSSVIRRASPSENTSDG